ncbi:hypothetical protein TTHERM_001107438 (macronuclear) [Tetrahymena thermophila SB210]|uniref:Uncharacterized protein n=1 Tax=Tetrahymena thermophila (strain SB210) TaxID=312017 RepID=W7XC09_TETTS|nr:hypothetical protein TTHERM_001107438 [Tetrahymena thermophila SB210]EWS71246.1 hypothetical protein TTHERM_001107438 [Tetrahymena thermophila SB210]|eukprot:XP_012656219.1 hypothetical protein TTHERM_001107438 [Tetrahymena thermophila SB210]
MKKDHICRDSLNYQTVSYYHDNKQSRLSQQLKLKSILIKLPLHHYIRLRSMNLMTMMLLALIACQYKNAEPQQYQ